jgi:hypothetical protein
MKITEEYQTVTLRLNEIVCDCCGKVNVCDDFQVTGDITSFSVIPGYGSMYDSETWELDICDECMVSWIKTFKHKPIGMVEDV